MKILQRQWDILQQDLRYAARMLARSPGFALTIMLVAALGIGATTAAFTLADHVLIRPLPFPDAARLVHLWEDMSPAGYRTFEPSPANYSDWKQANKSFEAMAASRPLSVNMVGVGDPEQLDGASVTADLLPMLGARTAIGRLFTAHDDRAGAPGTVVLSYGLWRRRFAADPTVLGRRVLFDGEPFVVIGVMQRGFDYPQRALEVWTPMRFANTDFEDRNNNYLRVLARLRRGVSIDQARAEMRLISHRLQLAYPKDNEHVGVTSHQLRDDVSGRTRLMLIALLGAAFCVLLIACTNIANLLLARALARRKEIAVRKALGAGSERLVRQTLTESLLLAVGGGALGVLLALFAVPLLAKLVPNSLPIAAIPAVSSRVLLFALALTTLTGICFGVIPSVRIASEAPAADLSEGARQGVGGKKQRLRSALVVAEIALSFVLLVSAGLFIRALWRLEQTNPGFRAENVLTMRTALPSPKYDSTSRRVQFYTHVLSQIRQLPGVTHAAYTSFLPIVVQGGIWPVTLAGQEPNRDRASHNASLRFITPGYFETMRIPLLRGRAITEADSEKAQYAAVVSDSFVRQYWPGQDPIGRQFDFGFATRTVVGIAGDVRVRGLERSSEPQVYLSYKQVPDGAITWYAPKDLVIRSGLDPEKLLPHIRRIIAEADPQQPIAAVQTLSHILDEDTAPRLLQVRALGGFAAIAILLAAIGIHGLLSFAVSNRSQEIAVRIAVGARSGNILSLVLRESLSLALIGTVLGIGLAYVAGRSLEALLVGVEPSDLPTYLTGVSLALLVTLAGSLWPALRALRVDPITALRAA
jgi:predicted permease